MKKWSTISAGIIFAIFAVTDLVHDFVSNDPIGYFSAEPHRLLYVVVIAVIGGFAALGFSQLSPRAKRHVQVFAWGSAASALTTIASYLASCFFSISSFIIESGSTAWILFVPLIFIGIAVYFWLGFYQTLKTRVSR